MEKKKKLIILGVILLLIIVSGATFAILTWNSTMIKLGINTNCFTIDYTRGGDITGSLKLINEEDLISRNIDSGIEEYSSIDNDNSINNVKFTIKEGVGVSAVNIGIKSDCSIDGYGRIFLNVTNISSTFTTGDSKGALKYAVLSNTSSITDIRSITSTSLDGQSFDIVATGTITSGGVKDILVRQLSNEEIYKYIIVIYVDNNLAGNDITEGVFTGNISADATQGLINADYTLNRLYNLNNSIVLDTTHTPDFTTVSGNNGVKYDNKSGNELATGVGDGTNGIYKSEDDFGTSYYFRGAVENNYVKFGKYENDLYYGYDDNGLGVVGFSCDNIFVPTEECYKLASAGDDMYWRIVRINGDGSIRMIYAGTEAYANGTENQNSVIGTSSYNIYSDDNGYIGYMYGDFTIPTDCSTSNGVITCTGGSTSHEEAHANINNSAVKTYVDNWYNIYLGNYAYAIADTIYCNDRSVTPIESFVGITLTGIGKGRENTAYSNLKRNWIDYAPTLKCVNKNDRFTVKNNIGNAKLTNPIGLITLDEAAMAGGVAYDVVNNSYITNPSYFLYNNWEYWSMTPEGTIDGDVGVGDVYSNGSLNISGVRGGTGAYKVGVRPVISLLPDMISGGNGTMDNPWFVNNLSINIIGPPV